jgi:hypothetical protein
MKIPSKKFFIYAFVIFIIAMLFFSIFSNKQVVEGYNSYELQTNLNNVLKVRDPNYDSLTAKLSSYTNKSSPNLYNSTLSQLMQNSKFKNLQNACKPFNSGDCSSSGLCQFRNNICDVKIPDYVGR